MRGFDGTWSVASNAVGWAMLPAATVMLPVCFVSAGAIRRANPVVFLGRADAMQAWARRLENLAFGEALRCKVGDRTGGKVSFTVLPDSNIIVAAEPDEGPSRRLLRERCARALDYALSII